MSKKFTRTITSTKIAYALVSVMDGKPMTEERTMTAVGKITDTKAAMKAIREATGDKIGQYVVLSMEQANVLYSCDVDKFVKIADIVPPKAAK